MAHIRAEERHAAFVAGIHDLRRGLPRLNDRGDAGICRTADTLCGDERRLGGHYAVRAVPGKREGEIDRLLADGLTGADAARHIALTDDDRARAGVLDDAVVKFQRFALCFGRSTLRHAFGIAIEFGIIRLHQKAAVDLLHVKGGELDFGTDIGHFEQNELGTIAERIHRLRRKADRDDKLYLHTAHLFGKAGIHNAVDRQDTALHVMGICLVCLHECLIGVLAGADR